MCVGVYSDWVWFSSILQTVDNTLGEEDSGPFPLTTDVYCVHIVAMLFRNFA